MITKFKIALIGATGVGKTSLATRYVHSIFSERYRTTVGVKIESKEVRRDDRVVQLVIWDISGEDEFQSVQPAYVAGSAGCVLVLDGTRRDTVDTGIGLVSRMRAAIGSAPFVVVVNKADLLEDWQVRAEDLWRLREVACGTVETSARTGSGVEHAFEMLVDAILAQTEPTAEARWT